MLVLSLSLLISAYARDLVYVIEVFRHGARAPEDFQPWDNSELWPDGPGSLTGLGMRQHYLLGKELRKRLIEDTNFLTSIFDQNEIQIFATDIDRTLMSAQCQLMGLYPDGTGETLRDSSLNQKAVPPITVKNADSIISQLGDNALPNQAQVIPIYSNPNIYQTELNPMGTNCAKLNQMQAANLQSDMYKNTFADYQDIVDLLANVLQVEKQKVIDDYWQIFDSVYTNKFHGHTLPEEFTDSIVYRMENLYSLTSNMNMYMPDEVVKLMSSELLKDISNELDLASKGLLNNKMKMFSGHDITIQALLYGMQILKNKFSWPPYAANILFMLYKEADGSHTVKVMFNDIELILPQCSVVYCPLNTFKSFIATRVIANFEQECQITEVTTVKIPAPEILEDAVWDSILILAAAIISSILVMFIACFMANYAVKRQLTELDPVTSEMISIGAF